MKRIILADDNNNFCDLTKRFLEQHNNYLVDVAFSIEDLKSRLRKREDYVAILLDIWFPNENKGKQALSYCLEEYPAIPVISISGSASPETAVESIKLGACDFIEKPVKMDRLLITLKNVIEKIDTLQQMNEYKVKAINMVGSSQIMQKLYENITKAAEYDCNVLITGETGTGKELVSNAIHKLSKRSNNNLVSINCSAIPNELIESQLFGHSQGAFTGAMGKHIGLAEQADRGTLILDEIEEFPLILQAKVLKFIENGFIQPLGMPPKKVNTRIISVSNKNILEMVDQKKFREDLYYRINVFEIKVPSLKDHREDIPQLVHHFLENFSRKQHLPTKQISLEAISLLMDQTWPGNVRQLKNIVRRCFMHSEDSEISVHHVQTSLMAPQKLPSNSLREALINFEKDYISKYLVLSNWNVSKTAIELGIDRSNLYKKIRSLGIELQ